MRSLFYGVAIFALAACGQSASDTTASDTATTTVAATESATTDSSAVAGTSATATTDTAATQEKPMSYENKVAELHTTAGQINIRFFPDVAPNHVKNFIDLAQQGFYNGTKFHRVIPGFMIQGGDPNTKGGDPSTWGTGGSPNRVRAEFNAIPHKRGIVSMARSNHPDSASSQFFIVVADSQFLDNNYTVFGEVTKGMEVADAIVNAPKAAGSRERPAEPVTITKVVVRDANEDEKGPTPK
ncbi:MAG TPA: peptidylprolyl isomerase [Thermoanaerobaculia bacterium]|nr:peptidylprolyl isomerase [Thermoanaerobaculia bacterium]